MNRTRASLRFVLSMVLFLLIVRLPIFIQVAEMRSFSADGEELSIEYSLGDMLEFIGSLPFIRAAWTTPPKVIYAALALVNLLMAGAICLGAMRILVWALEKFTGRRI